MTNTGLEAIATGENVTVVADTMHGQADDQRIDTWELQQSRRALTNLKTLLYEQPMRDLLNDQIEEADRRMRDYVAASDGQFTGTRVVLNIQGLKLAGFLPTLRSLFAATDADAEAKKQAAIDSIFPTEPEHYALPPGAGGIIETMGGIPTRSRPRFVQPEDVPECVSALIDNTYDKSMVGSASLDDGTVFTYVLQEYKDTPQGMQASLRIWYPAACPAAYLEEHAHHYAIEFRNGCRMAAAALNHTT